MTKSRQRRDGIASEMRSCFDQDHGHEPIAFGPDNEVSANHTPQRVASLLVLLAISVPAVALVVALTW